MKPLSLNSTGEDVLKLQAALNKCGAALLVDGVYGSRTVKAVVEFQAAKKLPMDGVAGARTLEALGLLLAEKVAPQLLVIHESDTPVNSPFWNAKRVVDLHVKTNGWGRPGYSRIIEESGNVVETWPVDLSDGFQPHEITYGVAEFNPISVNICYMGGMTADGKGYADTRTPEQRAALLKVVKDVIAQVPSIKVCGHNQLHNKLCPGFSVPRWLRSQGIADFNIYLKDPFGYATTLNG